MSGMGSFSNFLFQSQKTGACCFHIQDLFVSRFVCVCVNGRKNHNVC